MSFHNTNSGHRTDDKPLSFEYLVTNPHTGRTSIGTTIPRDLLSRAAKLMSEIAENKIYRSPERVDSASWITAAVNSQIAGDH